MEVKALSLEIDGGRFGIHATGSRFGRPNDFLIDDAPKAR